MRSRAAGFAQKRIFIMTPRLHGIGFLALFAFAVFFSTSAVEKSVCELTFADCPTDHDGETIETPLNVISLHARVKHCTPQIDKLRQVETPPSVMFVIDHSGSMEEPSAGNDLREARFNVVGDLLDEIYEINPETEVGVVSFANRLSFDQRDYEWFARMNSVGNNHYDSYLPLRPLNHPTWDLGTIKEILRTDQTQHIGTSDAHPYYAPRLIYGTRRPMTRTPASDKWPITSIRYGTDITLGFMAALEAFGNSHAPPDRRFIIFLSDGEATHVDKERESMIGLYYDSLFTQRVPTTFTVWFGDEPDPSLVEMTRLVQNNGYSESNRMSNLWSIKTPHNQLLQLLSSIVMEQIFPAKSTPNTAEVKGVQAAFMTDSTFNFTKPLPLNVTSDTLDMTFRYSIVDTSLMIPDTADTMIYSSVFVERRDNAQIPEWADTVCYTRILELHNNGVEVSEITPDMADLEVYFRTVSYDHDFDTSYLTAGDVTVSSVAGGDSFVKGLIPNGDHYIRPFQHEVSAQNNYTDLTIQHQALDSIKIVWRNTYHPLDTIELTVPLMHRSVDRPYTNKPNTRKFDEAALDDVVDTVFVASVTGITLNTDTAGATIWYTLDGTMPAAGNSAHRYNGESIEVTEDGVMITAFATKEEFANSKVLRVRYVRTYDRIPVQSAFYEDLDGDGIIDAFRLLVSPDDAGRLNMGRIAAHPELILLGDAQSGAFTITGISQGTNANQILVEVSPAKPSFIANRLIDVVIKDEAALREDGYLAPGALQATDRVAPVIAEAVYVLQQDTEKWNGKADTLKIRMSERFVIDPAAISPQGLVKPFTLVWTNQKSEYQLTLEPVGYDPDMTWYTFVVRDRGAGSHFPSDNDSIWIAPGIIRDVTEPPNVQNGANEPVLLQVNYPPLNMVAMFYPNPSKLGPERDILLAQLQELGLEVKPGVRTVLRVSPAPATDSAHTATHVRSVQVNIYDAVGNLVIAGLEGDRIRGSFYIQWDGRNSVGRAVGPGAYLAVVTVRLTGGDKQVRRVSLGLH